MDGLNDLDRDLLARIFGPELPDEVLGEGEEASAVDWAAGPDPDAAGVAVAILVSNIVFKGIGGFPLGWTYRVNPDGRCKLAVYRFRDQAERAA